MMIFKLYAVCYQGWSIEADAGQKRVEGEAAGGVQ